MQPIMIARSFLLAASVLSNAAFGQPEWGSNNESQPAPDASYIGLKVVPVPPAVSAQLPGILPANGGVCIEEVVRKSPAEGEGLMRYDILLQFNDRDIRSPNQLAKLVGEVKPGQEVKVEYLRAGKRQEALIRPAAVPGSDQMRPHTSFRFPLDQLLPMPGFELKNLASQSMTDETKLALCKSLESMVMKRIRDDQFEVSVAFRSGDQERRRQYTGTQNEIRKAVNEDKELPREIGRNLQHLLGRSEAVSHMSGLLRELDWEASGTSSRELPKEI